MIKPKNNISKLYRTNGSPRKNYLRLDKNDSVNVLSNEFVDKVLKEVTPEFLAMYPEYEDVERKLAKYHNVEEDNIFLANGSDSAIKNIFETYITDKKEVLLTEPTFAMYRVYCDMFGIPNKSILYKDIHSFPFLDIIDNINNNTQLIVIINPNNPTCSIILNKQLEILLDKAHKMNSLVIVDEAYQGIYKNSSIPLIKKYNNLIILRTFSKFGGLATLRFGYAIASKDIIENLKKIRPSYDINGIACLFVEKILDNNLDLVEDCKIGKEFLCKQLKKYNMEFIDGETNFILIKCDVPKTMDKLRKGGILVGGNFKHPILKDYIRVTVGKKIYMEKFWDIFYE